MTWSVVSPKRAVTCFPIGHIDRIDFARRRVCNFGDAWLRIIVEIRWCAVELDRKLAARSGTGGDAPVCG